MNEIKVTTLNEFGERLVGIESTPDIKKDKYPTVILVHGFATGKNMESIFTGLLKELIAGGFLVYRFDFSGCGESEGDYSKTSLSKLKSDLRAMINFVKVQPKVDVSRIGILAQSTGTTVTVALAPDVKCLVLTGSIFHYKEVMVDIFGKGYNPEGISARTKANGTVTRIGSQFWKDIITHNLLESVKRIHCPILFIHGVNSETESFVKTQSDKNGAYLYNFDTSPLELGQHLTKAKASLDGQVSPFGKSVSFAVGTKTVAGNRKCGIGDLNCDGRVNLVDFSIMLYWWKKPNIIAGLNVNGIVDLPDFSIMLYWWTG